MITPTAVRQADLDSSYVSNIYVRLLADIEELSGVPLGAPGEHSYEWMLKEAPKLDKELLLYLEGSGILPVFPEWIKPLMDVFLSSMDGKYLRYIRQLLLFCYKIEFEPTYEQLKEAQASFEEAEECVGVWDSSFSKTIVPSPVFSFARQIVGLCIYKIDWTSILPSHGPGAVYPSVITSDKSKFTSIYRTIEEYYPFGEYLCGMPTYVWQHIVQFYGEIQEREHILSRLVAVPKDSRGPRLICVHPKESVWIQQGCRRLLERAITSPRCPAYGRINFHDQGVNGGLALSSSKSKEFCTLDLKEASDRISCKLVQYLFGDYAYRYISCSRASRVKLLDDRVIELRKWAPMGNALTFPVQSLIFYALVRAGIRARYGTNCNDVYVFGDDILFPVKYYDGAVNALVRSGLVPNTAKTFRHGLFRESCGVDAFNGIDVTPHRLRGIDSSSVSGAMSLCTLARAMRISGYRLTSDILYRYVQNAFGSLHISNNPHAQGLYRYENCDLGTLLKYEDSTRFNRHLHKWETKLRLVGGVLQHVPNDAWWHLQDSLLSLIHRGSSEVATRGLEYAVPHRTRLKRGWTDVI